MAEQDLDHPDINVCSSRWVATQRRKVWTDTGLSISPIGGGMACAVELARRQCVQPFLFRKQPACGRASLVEAATLLDAG